MLVGYHLCYGTFPEWPMYEAQDMSAARADGQPRGRATPGRPVDWLHMAGPRYLRSEDERFFAPLRDLDVGDTRVFLGIVLPIDGIAGPAPPARDGVEVPRRLRRRDVLRLRPPARARTATETMREHRDVVTALRG